MKVDELAVGLAPADYDVAVVAEHALQFRAQIRADQIDEQLPVDLDLEVVGVLAVRRDADCSLVLLVSVVDNSRQLVINSL